MGRKAIFIAATGQNVGKTTICLGLISGFKKKTARLGFMKPVGQQHVKTPEGLLVDKDVVLFKEYFHLLASYETMSPLIVPAGFTRDYLDGKVSTSQMREKILSSFEEISTKNDFTIVEGTGHVGVGSILNLNNAEVAALLKLDVVLIAGGGLGSTFDELALNKALLDQYGVKIRGVILNKVHEEKREMVIDYMTKGLARWGIPLLGCIPFSHYLSTSSMEDFELLFHTKLQSGEEFRNRHFETIRLVATSVETFKELILPNQLIVTPATREDIVYALIERRSQLHKEVEHGVILTGRHPPTPSLILSLQRARIPALYAAHSSFNAMQMITSFIAKTRKEDVAKVEKAIRLVEGYLDFSFVT